MITPIFNSSVLNARHALSRNLVDLARASHRLASGRRINSGKDDPAGLIVSERLAAELKSLAAENRGLQRADAFANITEGHTSQLSSLLRDLNGLVVAGANQGALSDSETAANQTQIDSIVASIERISQDAVSSLDGFNMPDGGNAKVAKLIDDAMLAVSSVRSGGANSLDSGNFDAAQTTIESAISDVATARGRIGGYQRYTVAPRIRSNQVAIENLSESRSRIADTDYAAETSNRIRASILSEVSFKLLKIAQQQGKSVLALLA